MVQRTILRLPFPGGRPGPKPGPYLLDGVGYSRQAKVQSDDAALVFVSYSRGDHEWRAKFVEMLQPVLRERGLVVWSDERNLAGEAWRPQIAGAIERACAALLLVSPGFLDSDFVMGQELPALLARDIPLFCVLVRPCLFDKVPALEALQWAHDPKRDGALSDARNREGQIVRVCRRVLAGIPAAERRGAPLFAGDPQSRRVVLTASTRRGELHDVPPLPLRYVPRNELAHLRDALPAVEVLGLHGEGGTGKTVVATALARDEDVRRHFPDGVFWVPLGERPDLVGAQMDLLARIGVAPVDLRRSSEGVERLRDALAERRALLVVDDLWSAAAASAFNAAGPQGGVLYTTRDRTLLPGLHARAVPIDVLSPETARGLLATAAGLPERALPAEAERVLRATESTALALALVGAAVRGGHRWNDIADALERGGETFLDHPYANAFKTLQVAVAALDDELQTAYRTLAVYPEDTAVPMPALTHYWKHLFGWRAARTKARARALAERSLLKFAPEGVTLHDLARRFLLLETAEQSLLHADLMATYGDLHRLRPDEPYIWEHLVSHLRDAGDAAGIARLVRDPAFLAVRGYRAGPHAAESDLAVAAELNAGGDPAITWLQRLFAQSGHLLARRARLEDVAAALASGLQDAPEGIDVADLAHLLPARFLWPRWGLRRAPPSLLRILDGHTSWVNAVAFSPDGGLLASAGHDDGVRLWRTSDGQPHAILEGHTGAVNAVVFAPDGRQVVSAGDDATVRLWNSADGRCLTVLEGHLGSVNAVALAPAGDMLASAGSDATVRLWEVGSDRPGRVLTGHVRTVNGIAFSHDGKLLASGGDDRTVRVWETEDGRPVMVLESHAGWVNAVAFAPGGLLASASAQTVQLWDVAGGRQDGALTGHRRTVNAVAFAPGGHVLASAGDDKAVRLWSMARGEGATALEYHAEAVLAVAFSPDGALLASGGVDQTVALWDPSGDHRRGDHEGHTRRVHGVAGTSDGTLLASASF